MKSKKLEVLLGVYKELSEEFGKFNDADLNKIVESWSISIKDVNEMLCDPDSPVRPSQIATGFEQGLRELPSLLFDLQSQVRTPAVRTMNEVIGKYLPEFYVKQQVRLESIVSVGKIRNEYEWYLVRSRMDDIEGLPNSKKEFELLDGILLAFENSV